ncbi:MAG: hypothetical protein ACE5JP_03950 [Candidatus Bipolaricaulia bacterium]
MLSHFSGVEAAMSASADRATRLQRARAHIFATGPLDSGRSLCIANMQYGLAKLHYLQEQLGLPPDATFIGSPDMTVTRNINRWESGFSYGGKLCWGDGQVELMVLDLKPNACGMILGGLDQLPDAETVLHHAHQLNQDRMKIDGIKIRWDFGKSNHFIDIFRVRAIAHQSLPPYAFLIHAAGSELRGENPLGDGLYYDASPSLRGRAEVVETPFGSLHILTGSQATRYYEYYQWVEAFVRRRRRLAAERIFGDYRPLHNETHQGLIGPNEMVLGTHPIVETERILYPLALRGDLPVYLFRGTRNLTPEVIENLGFAQRARELGVYERLLHADILPHGGGYDFPHLARVCRVLEVSGKRYFEVEFANDRGRKIISNPRSLPFDYRGKQVALRTMELGLGELVAKLIPLYVLKV